MDFVENLSIMKISNLRLLSGWHSLRAMPNLEKNGYNGEFKGLFFCGKTDFITIIANFT